MDQVKQQEHFSVALKQLIERHAHEYDLTYASMIGIMQIVLHDLCRDCINTQEKKEKGEQ